MQTERVFRRALSALGGPKRARDTVGGRWVLVPPSRDYPVAASGGSRPKSASAAERRRRNLTVLAGFIIITFLVGLIPPLRFLLYVNLAADVLLIAYLGAAVYVSSRPVGSARSGAAPTRLEPESQTGPQVVGGGW